MVPVRYVNLTAPPLDVLILVTAAAPAVNAPDPTFNDAPVTAPDDATVAPLTVPDVLKDAAVIAPAAIVAPLMVPDVVRVPVTPSPVVAMSSTFAPLAATPILSAPILYIPLLVSDANDSDGTDTVPLPRPCWMTPVDVIDITLSVIGSDSGKVIE